MKTILAATAAILLAVSIDIQAASSSGTGLYVRGEGGVSFARDAKFRDDNPADPNCFLLAAVGPVCTGELGDLGRGWVLGVGVGYRLPGGFRAEVNYNHRSGYKLKGRDPAGTDFDPPVKTDGLMVSGTYDLPVMMGSLKPFVGLGVGRSRNEMEPIKWNDPTCCSGTLTGGKKTDFAYQITLGADLAVAQAWTLEFIYRYTDLGRFVKDAGRDLGGPPFTASGMTAAATGRLRFNEFIFAIRRDFN